MAQPVYKLFLFKFTEAYYQLSEQERKDIAAKVGASLEQAGGKRIVQCSTVWASEEWLAWGVEQFPSMEAAQMHAMDLWQMDWFRYVESKTYLGMELPAG